jgi:phospholipid/cholesterol/gamma-HCH transport system ATP-binding protein
MSKLTTPGAGACKPFVQIESLSFSRGERRIFDKVNIQAKTGKITAIMGPSGSGKTTLLRLIGGQLAPDEGRVCVDGVDLQSLGRGALYNVRRRIGMLFQSGALFSDMSVFDNVAFPLREHTELPEFMIRDLVLMKLQAVGLRGAHSFMPAELSGGMARRVALARAIALDPALLMFDEPFAGQDPISMGVLVKLIQMLNQILGMTVIIVSHDVQETMSIADEAYIISDARVIEYGAPNKLETSKNGWVQQFLQGLPDGPVPFHYPAPAYANDLWGPRA